MNGTFDGCVVGQERFEREKVEYKIDGYEMYDKNLSQEELGRVQWRSLPNRMEKSHTSSVTGGMTSTSVEGEEGMGPIADRTSECTRTLTSESEARLDL
ncbi:hypothetical protein E2C01_064605 [Portunus trituberculatus]|uniref:Uncharacterized protein n=1 Tax=Portunus trituberculatus TaxID=210409 RepID=A0A5B7HDG9_PORTR|nr:hypothetical protein [Portunus trituberculatus]